MSQPPDPVSPAPSPSSRDERRRVDRRGADRQGKYDRRKNRCVHCTYFAPGEPETLGQCEKHRSPMSENAFACPDFEPPPL